MHGSARPSWFTITSIRLQRTRACIRACRRQYTLLTPFTLCTDTALDRGYYAHWGLVAPSRSDMPHHKRVLVQACRLSYLSVCLSICLVSELWKNGWLIRITFGVVSGVSRGMGVLDRGGDHRRGRSSFGVNVGHSIVTNEDFVA